jgi:hypothetical protein
LNQRKYLDAWRTKKRRTRDYGRSFPASQYDDPRGGRPAALERNILRYRAAEAALYLFYAQEVREFMLTNLYPRAVEDSLAERQGKKLEIAFAQAVKIGMFTEAESNEVKELLDYRNDIAHRIHLVTLDVSRCYWAADHLSFMAPTYKGDALDRLREYRRSLWKRTQTRLVTELNMDPMLFEFAERTYEEELKRLDRRIQTQIDRERVRAKAIGTELDLRGTELVGDLDPRFPSNHRHSRSFADDYAPPSGHLTKRGVEICYRLYDLGKSPIAVAYLMGMSLRAAENRRKGWLKAGGLQRVRTEVNRYELKSRNRLVCL